MLEPYGGDQLFVFLDEGDEISRNVGLVPEIAAEELRQRGP